MGLHLRGKTFWWHFCYYYLNQLNLISVNITESLHEQKTNPLVMFAELIFWDRLFFTPCINLHVCLVCDFCYIFWILFAILQLNCWFSTFSILRSPLLQIKTHHFPLLGTTQFTPQGRLWWEQGGRELCLPIPPPLAPTQRMRNPDLSISQGRDFAAPLQSTSCAGSLLFHIMCTEHAATLEGDDWYSVRLTRRLFKVRICSEVKGPFKVLRYLPNPGLPFLPALLCPFLPPQPWNETENYFFKTVSIIYV